MSTLLRWVPALLMMTGIFIASATPSSLIPSFGPYDVYFKKAGHALGYGLLGVSYYYALPTRLPRSVRWLMALALSLGFALSDEFHQSFVQGRNSSVRDVAIDVFGAVMALFLAAGYSTTINFRPREKTFPNSGPD